MLYEDTNYIQRGEVTCLRWENLLIPLVAVGKCLKVKVETLLSFQRLPILVVETPSVVGTVGISSFLTGQCTGLELLPWSLSMKQVEPWLEVQAPAMLIHKVT